MGPSMPNSTLTEANCDKLKRVSTATLTTVLFKRGLRNTFLLDVHPLNAQSPRMVGPAFTLRNIPAREDIDHLGSYDDWEHPQRKAVETVPSGHVLVIDSPPGCSRRKPPGIFSSPA